MRTTQNAVHTAPHPLAWSTTPVRIKDGVTDPRGYVVGGAEFMIFDWYDRLVSSEDTNYASRLEAAGVEYDDEVLYGHIGAFGHPVHISELDFGDTPAS